MPGNNNTEVGPALPGPHKMLTRVATRLEYLLIFTLEPINVEKSSEGDYNLVTYGRTNYPHDLLANHIKVYIDQDNQDIEECSVDSILRHELGHALCDKVLGDTYHSMPVESRERLADTAALFIKSIQKEYDDLINT